MYTEAMKKKDNLHLKGILEDQFKFYLLMLRYVGVPLISSNNSKIYTLYSALPVLCVYSLFVAIVLDIIQHKHNLQRIMEDLQNSGGTLSILWIHQCFR
jgi:Na+/glutamate symporter